MYSKHTDVQFGSGVLKATFDAKIRPAAAYQVGCLCERVRLHCHSVVHVARGREVGPCVLLEELHALIPVVPALDPGDKDGSSKVTSPKGSPCRDWGGSPGVPREPCSC
jgi:hypothetical protein